MIIIHVEDPSKWEPVLKKIEKFFLSARWIDGSKPSSKNFDDNSTATGILIDEESILYVDVLDYIIKNVPNIPVIPSADFLAERKSKTDDWLPKVYPYEDIAQKLADYHNRCFPDDYKNFWNFYGEAKLVYKHYNIKVLSIILDTPSTEDVVINIAEDKAKILETYQWIKVRKDIDDINISWKELYHKLQTHHIEETNFLIEKIREIVKTI